MSLGKAIRLQRIFGDPSGHLLSVAVDHWIGYPKTMTDGLHDLPKTLVQIAAAKPGRGYHDGRHRDEMLAPLRGPNGVDHPTWLLHSR